MICKRVRYKNFRNIADQIIEPASGVTMLYGDNGEGKTNALEAIYLFAQGRSFRTAHDRDMIRFGCDEAEVELEFSDKNRNYSMYIKYLPNGRRICKRNDIDIRRMSEFIGYFRAVLFCPNHLAIVKDGPSIRRNFIDTAISQIKPFYMASLQRYNSILNQRNSLIKNYYNEPHDFHRTVRVWSEQLAREAAEISEERAIYIEKLNKHTTEFLADMTDGKEIIELTYQKYRTESEFLTLLTDNPEREVRAGATLYGIHKDDIDIKLNGREARGFASQGQQRSIALSMKLSEGEISKKESGEYPVFLLDDILSELDSGRRKYLTAGLGDRQIIMTSCEGNFDNLKTEKILHVKNGEYNVSSCWQ